MAYVLGFFVADGCMVKNRRGAHFVEFTSTDIDVLMKIRTAMGSNHKISKRRSNGRRNIAYRFQIGSKEIFSDLTKFGLTPHKSKTVQLPNIPVKYLCHFVRGYFDGDGCVSYGNYRRQGRDYKSPTLSTRFVSGSYDFLTNLHYLLRRNLHIEGSLCFSYGAWRLTYSTRASKKLFYFMYPRTKDLIYLQRKYRIYQRAGVA